MNFRIDTFVLVSSQSHLVSTPYLGVFQKAMYVDGHERPDVVAYHKEFWRWWNPVNSVYHCLSPFSQISMQFIHNCDSLWWTYDDKTLEPIKPNLGPGDKSHVPLTHDKVIFQLNELQCRGWTRKCQMPLWKKNLGCKIHNSGYIVKQTGQLALSELQIEEQNKLSESQQLLGYESWDIIYPGKNGGSQV